MKLSNEYIKIILNFGYEKKDLKQIGRAITVTTYESNNKKISKETAMIILGLEEYLSGICRSAFHWTACRDNNGITVYFNSSKVFCK